jgi:hypothetical protein
MENFNIKRFWQTLKWQILYHKSKDIKRLLTCACVFFFLMLFLSYTSIFVEQYSSAMSSILHAAFIIYLLFCGSSILRMSKRQQYVDKLMLPASKLEKYTASYLLTIVLGLAVLAVSFVVADVVNYLVMLLLNSDKATLVTLSLFNQVSDSNEYATAEEVVADVLAFWWIHSLYLLGGTFFRKRNWIFTTLTLIVAFLVVGGGLTFVTWKTLNLLYGDYFRIVFIDGAEGYIGWGLAILTSAFIVLNYWLSYRFYKRIQLIGHKFTNR